MIYMIGGAPRSGKSILGQQIAANLRIGWMATDILLDLLRFKGVEGVKTEWNADPGAIAAAAEWFFPSLERLLWGVSSMADHYLIEGVDFLPVQIERLAGKYPLRAVFLGRSRMTLDQFDHFPGRSKGYADLPEARRQEIARDVPRWSEFIREEAERCGCAYVDTSGDFRAALSRAESVLSDGRGSTGRLLEK